VTPDPSSTVEVGWRRTAIVVGVMLATLLQTLDATIVNVALPNIEGNLGASVDEGAWIVTTYLIAAVIVIPLTPWLHLRLGRKRFYIMAVLGFTIASTLCGLSSSFDMLVLFRTLQGLCGGGLVATAQTILRDTFPANELNKSQMLLALGAVAGPSLGPTVGGVLTDNASWNWIFFINLVPGLASVALIWRFLRDVRPGSRRRIDYVGLMLLCVALGSMEYVLNQGERYDWFSDERIAIAVSLSAIAFPTFVYWELKATTIPIVDLKVLRHAAVAAGSLLAVINGFSLFGIIVLLPQFAQGILGFTATLSGEQVLVRALAVAAATPFTLFILNRLRVSPVVLLSIGFLIVAIANGMQALAVTTDSSFWTFAPPLALGGFGFAFLSTPLNVSVLRSVSQNETPKAAAFVSLSQQLGGSLATAVLLTFVDRRLTFHSDVLAGYATLSRPVVHSFIDHHSVNALNVLIQHQSAATSFGDVSWLLAVVTTMALPLTFFMLKRFNTTTAGVQFSRPPLRGRP